MKGDFEPVRYFVKRNENPIEMHFFVRRALADEEPKPFEQEVMAYTAEEATVIARRPRTSPDAPQMFTSDEMIACVKALVKAQGGPEPIMAHIRAEKQVTPEAADAIRKIVVAAYIDMLVGE